MSKTDLVVVLPGIMGSTLARNNKPVWEPSAGAVLRALSTFGRSIKQLQLPHGIGDARLGRPDVAVARPWDVDQRGQHVRCLAAPVARHGVR